MLLILKPHKKDMPLLLRTVNDLHECNVNTYNLTLPLPYMEGMLRRVAWKKYQLSMDLVDAYEQIRIVPEHVDQTATTTPDGNMVSLVIQIGDAYIGRFMDICILG